MRDAGADDLSPLHLLNQDNRPHVGDVDRTRFDWFAEHACCFRVAWIGAERVGFMIALDPAADYGSENFRWFRDRYDHFVYVDRLAVSEAARRRGVGRALYRDLAEFAAERAPFVTCEVNLRPPNPTSLAFHHTLGFREVGQQETEGGRYRVSLLLVPPAELDAR
ncbi:MAG: GNAT family N-acetyltransferase [Planctomycetota bacterium]